MSNSGYRLHCENNAHRAGDRSALAKIGRELDRLVQALMDDVPASRVKDGEDNSVLIHPKMAGYYRDEVARLREALSGDDGSDDATNHMRKLIGQIVLTPVEDKEGHKSLSIDLHGHQIGNGGRFVEPLSVELR